MNHVVIQTITHRKHYGFILLFLKQIKTCHRTYPSPSATVNILAICALSLKLIDVLRQLCHHIVINQRLRVRPRIAFEGRCCGTSIEHTSALGTYPNTALLVESNHIAVCLHFRAISHCEFSHPLQIFGFDIVNPVAILRSYINLIFEEGHIIQVVGEFRYGSPHFASYVKPHHDTPLLSVSHLEETIAIRQHHRRSVESIGKFTIISLRAVFRLTGFHVLSHLLTIFIKG